ncbi:hypothetical protein Poly51_45130 [Rubripirellula tenax]|uniref:Uncharacterized protein n=1 Tax=Rubripirellula tenax TaxID=2528015 RepID=A0A5C6EHX0_9BACT|nr:hypothetical protein [Rubripirellula tenax]TWU48612.1 hypothetical protein Poly51_45130 [Rubripirellula tenax]
MTLPPISSSNRIGDSRCDAVLASQDRCTGPVRLPISRASDFVDQFNRTYQSVGLKLTANKATANWQHPSP